MPNRSNQQHKGDILGMNARLPGMMAALLLLTTTSLLVVVSPEAQAYQPEPDLMMVKGYSPATIELTQVQRQRNEWKEPPARIRTPWQQFWYNVWNNDWTGSVDPFGRSVIRQNQ